MSKKILNEENILLCNILLMIFNYINLYNSAESEYFFVPLLMWGASLISTIISVHLYKRIKLLAIPVQVNDEV